MSIFNRRKASKERLERLEATGNQLAEKVARDQPRVSAIGKWFVDRRIENGIELDLRFDLAIPQQRKR